MLLDEMNDTDGGFANQGNNMTQQSVLNAFDFSAIEEMDPSLGKCDIFLTLQPRDMSSPTIEKRHSNCAFRTLTAAHKRSELLKPSESKFCSSR